MENPRINILLPSANRPEKLRACLETLEDSYLSPRVIVNVVHGDRASLALALSWRCLVMTSPKSTAINAWNQMYRDMPTADYVVLAADDLRFYPGWLKYAMSAHWRTGKDLIGFNDLSPRSEEYASHWLVSCKFLNEHLGGVMLPPVYKSWYTDQEVIDIAKREKMYHYEHSAVVEHLHPEWGKSRMDETYLAGNKYHENDRAIYEDRKSRGFPIEWTPGGE